MSNKIYEIELFNSRIKEQYLSEFSPASRIMHERVLKRAAYLEEQARKDLYNFNISEIEKFMNFLAPTTYESSSSSLIYIRAYIKWAISRGLRKDNLNPLPGILDQTFVNRFVDQSNKYFFNETEIADMVGRIANFQDSAIVQCLFEGIMGTCYSEILHLQKKDIDRSKASLAVQDVANSGKVQIREAAVSAKLMNMLHAAAHERTYLKNNGNFTATSRTNEEAELVDNRFVFRNAIMHTKDFEMANRHLITRRLANVSKWFDYPHLTASNLKKSGMLKAAHDLYLQSGKFGREETIEVCKQFNVAYHITTRITRSFLNLENIKKLYPAE